MERRILAVEDSPTQRERLRLLLEGEGYHVTLARNGREGLEKLGSEPPDLIISDVVMPEMDGYAFCHAVKSSPQASRIPFILFTERHTPIDIIEGFLRGADNFIPKSSSDEYLLERVRRILEQLERRRQNQLTVEIVVRVGDRDIPISADKQQIFELLVSSVEEAGRANEQLREAQRLLEERARDLERHVEERTRELSKAEKKYRALVEQIPAVIYVAAPDQVGRTLYISPQIETLLGFPAAEWEAGPELWRQRLHADDRDHVFAEFGRLRRTGEPVSSEYRLLARDGRVVWVRDDARLIPDGVFVQGVLSDITERKGLEAQLRQAQKMEAIGQLAGGVAHDFNNLLGVITGYCELLARDIAPEHPGRKRVEQIRTAANRAADLTRQLLAFGRKQVLEPKIVDLNAAVEEVEKMLRRLIGEDIQLVTACGPAIGRARVDPGQVQQVIMNLAVNARDAMPEGGKLIIETANAELDEGYARTHADVRPGPYVLLAVSDTGHGMDAETLSHAFEPFFTTKEPGKGTGLGLATVYGIVKQSGGHVNVYSEPGRGSTFKVYLPRVDREEGRAAAEAPAPERPPSGSETILLVEDAEALRVMIREILEAGGYSVLEAPGPEEALTASRSHAGPVHLLLTDVVMPRMSGGQLAASLKGVRSDFRVLYMSGYTDEAIGHHGVLEGGTAYLQKPFTTDALLRKVREVLDAKGP